MTAGASRVDMAKVKARKDAIVEASRTGVGNWMASTKNVSVIHGHARFAGPHEISVSSRLLRADKIFINVGGRPTIPRLEGIETVPYITNISMMDVDFLAPHLIVIGGSYIGLEFAQIYRRFGAEVTVCEMGPRLIAREDEDVSLEIRAILEREGITVRTGGTRLKVDKVDYNGIGNGIIVAVICEGEEPANEGSNLLLATGSVPNTDDLANGTRWPRPRPDETQGFMKIVVDAETKRILGAAMLGLSGGEVVQSVLEIMYANKPYTQINRGVYIHPTVTELVPILLEGLKPLAN